MDPSPQSGKCPRNPGSFTQASRLDRAPARSLRRILKCEIFFAVSLFISTLLSVVSPTLASSTSALQSAQNAIPPATEVNAFAALLQRIGFPSNVPLPDGTKTDLKTFASLQLQIATIRKQNPQAQYILDVYGQSKPAGYPTNSQRQRNAFRELATPPGRCLKCTVLQEIINRFKVAGQFLAAIFNQCSKQWGSNYRGECDVDATNGLQAAQTPFPKQTDAMPTPEPSATIPDLPGNPHQTDLDALVGAVHALQSASPLPMASVPPAFATAIATAAGSLPAPSSSPQPLPQVTIDPTFSVGKKVIISALTTTTFTPPTFSLQAPFNQQTNGPAAAGVAAHSTIVLTSALLGLSGDPKEGQTATVDASMQVPHNGNAPSVTVTVAAMGQTYTRNFMFNSATSSMGLRWPGRRFTTRGIPSISA